MSEDYAAAVSAYLGEADGADDGSGNPSQLVVNAVEACLALAATWHGWNGRPVAGTVDGKPNTWTPQKALRRITDHLIDHLHQVEALLAGAEPVPDTWHGRFVTLDADWGRFTEADFDEACSRLRRLARWYVLRVRGGRCSGLGRATRRGMDAARDRRARVRGALLRRAGRIPGRPSLTFPTRLDRIAGQGSRRKALVAWAMEDTEDQRTKQLGRRGAGTAPQRFT